MDEKKELTIKWLGHSCFLINYADYKVVFDPYKDGSVPGLKNLRVSADEVHCSHDHDDHSGRECVKFCGGMHINPWICEHIDSYHDNKMGTVGGINEIHIIDNGYVRIAHLGDLGCELSDAEIKIFGHIDVMMIPIGGCYTINAKMAKDLVDKVKPTITIPMHYRTEYTDFKKLGDIEKYTKLCQDVIRYEHDTLVLPRDLHQQTAILSLSRDLRQQTTIL